MPRRTHAPAKRKHSRAHTRHHRERVIDNRWRRAKLRWSSSWMEEKLEGIHPEEALEAAAEVDRLQRPYTLISWEWGLASGEVRPMPEFWGYRREHGSSGPWLWPYDVERGRFASEDHTLGCHRGKKHCPQCSWEIDSRARRNAQLDESHPID